MAWACMRRIKETVSTAAYSDYTQGMAMMHRDNNSADPAMQFFERSAQIDPKSALPMAGSAEAQL